MLNEILAQLSGEQRAEILKAVQAATKQYRFIPNPGPQTQALLSPADELFYGGAAGGGKTFLLAFSAVYEHERSLLFRREYPQIRGMVDEVAKLLGSHEGYNAQNKIWKLPNGKIIEFGSVQHEEDKEKYQGRPHDLKCVARGTPVLLPGGKHRAIEDLRSGEFVQTLEGPRRILRTIPIRYKPCVEVIAKDYRGRVVARQVQSATHALLTEKGWFSAVDLDDACGSTQCCGTGMRGLWSRETCGVSWRRLSETIHRWQRMAESYWLSMRCRSSLVTLVDDLLSILGNDFGAFVYRCVGGLRPLLSSGHGVRPVPWNLSDARAAVQPINWRAICGELEQSLLQDLKGHYSSGIHPCGAHIRQQRRYLTSGESDRQCLLLLTDAGRPSPTHSQGDDGGCTRIHTHPLRTYPHPYMREIRSIDECGSPLAVSAFEITHVGVREVFDLTVDEVNHYITGNGFINKNCFDEITHFTESQFRFLTAWNRTTTPGQRCRVIATGNPPFTAEGQWVRKYWGPWLDPENPNPAKDGELRWFTTIDGKDTEVAGRGPHSINGREVFALSRTFIRARLEDTPQLLESGYAAKLEAMEEPFRTMMREGSFDITAADTEFQVIPTSWIIDSQNRWSPDGWRGVAMTAMSFDPAGGGADAAVLVWRHGGWYAPIISRTGPDTAEGGMAAEMVARYRRDAAPLVIDAGGGYGDAIVQRMRDNGVAFVKFNGANSSNGRTLGSKLKFANKRAEAWWRFREALDPEQQGGSVICLPRDVELRADLAAPTFQVTPRGIVIESKDDLRKRLGRSPGRGDTVVMCLTEGSAAVRKTLRMTRDGGLPAQANVGYANIKRFYK